MGDAKGVNADPSKKLFTIYTYMIVSQKRKDCLKD